MKLKSEQDIEKMRTSGNILARILHVLHEKAVPGVRLIDLDEHAALLLKEVGARAAFLGYRPEGARVPYPAHICACLNEVVVHDVPTETVLREGDVLSIDFGVEYDGYITDAAFTKAIGVVDRRVAKLIKATRQALEEAIRVCRIGSHMGDIGWAIEHVVKRAGFTVIDGLTGHGVGFALHEDPVVHNFGEQGTGMLLKEGMVLAIEPMVSMGAADIRQQKNDSYVTRDASLSAHFEATVAITSDGGDVLTPLVLC